MTKHTARWLLALATCAMMIVAPTATATPREATTAEVAAKAKLSASLLDTKVKVNGKARIRAKLDLPDAPGRGLELVVVQKLVAGVWLDVLTTDCRPNDTFRLRVSFSVAAQYTLRLYHPSTAVASASLSLTVIG